MMKTQVYAVECPGCGARDLDNIENHRWKCTYCGTVVTLYFDLEHNVWVALVDLWKYPTRTLSQSGTIYNFTGTNKDW